MSSGSVLEIWKHFGSAVVTTLVEPWRSNSGQDSLSKIPPKTVKSDTEAAGLALNYEKFLLLTVFLGCRNSSLFPPLSDGWMDEQSTCRGKCIIIYSFAWLNIYPSVNLRRDTGKYKQLICLYIYSLLEKKTLKYFYIIYFSFSFNVFSFKNFSVLPSCCSRKRLYRRTKRPTTFPLQSIKSFPLLVPR